MTHPGSIVGAFVAVLVAGALPGSFAVAAVVVGGAALAAPLSVPNHVVVAGFVAALLVIGRGADPVAARALYGALMLTAAMQKLLSPSFLDGSFLSTLWLTGGLLRPMWLDAGWAQLFADNQALADAAGLGEPVVLRGPRHLWVWGLLGSWAVLAVEGVLAGLAVRGGTAFFALATAFVVALPLVRDEPVFASVTATLTALCMPQGRWRWALHAFATVAALLSLAR